MFINTPQYRRSLYFIRSKKLALQGVYSIVSEKLCTIGSNVEIFCVSEVKWPLCCLTDTCRSMEYPLEMLCVKGTVFRWSRSPAVKCAGKEKLLVHWASSCLLFQLAGFHFPQVCHLSLIFIVIYRTEPQMSNYFLSPYILRYINN